MVEGQKGRKKKRSSKILDFFFRKQAHCKSQPTDILKAVKKVADHERHVILDMVVCKSRLVNPASSATR